MTSRMVARSTIAGTPVKSCISTRAGRNAISFSRRFAVGEDTSARTSSAETVCPSSKRSRFSSITFNENGSFETSPAPDFSAPSNEKYSNSALPAFNVDCDLNAEKFTDKVRQGRRHGADAEHAESAKEKIAASKDRNDATEYEQTRAAYNGACDERSIARKQKIWNDGNDRPRSK